MKIMIGFLTATISFFSATSFAAECQPKTAEEYWAPKLGKLSTQVGITLPQLKTQKSIPVDIGPLLSQWIDAVYSTAKEINETFNLHDDKNATQFATTIENILVIEGKWDYSQSSYPFISFDVDDKSSDNDTFTLNGGPKTRIEVNTQTEPQLSRCQEKLQCSSTTLNVCQLYAAGWAKAVSAYTVEASRTAPKEMAKVAIEYEKDWQAFFANGRSQTLLDRMLTARIYRNELKSSYFERPPDYQWFFIHPGVAMEYIDGAQDGEQFEMALSVEWLGINNWRGCDLGFAKIPYGISLVNTLSDKASTDDIGYGLMFHIYNSYSFGVVDRDGEVGIFVTVDLLKAFENKIERVQKWKQEAESMFE